LVRSKELLLYLPQKRRLSRILRKNFRGRSVVNATTFDYQPLFLQGLGENGGKLHIREGKCSPKTPCINCLTKEKVRKSNTILDFIFEILDCEKVTGNNF
jgi:hypothetical protein